jgi:low affinity Fe/Cu permease
MASGWLGSTWAFAAAGLLVIVWAAAGPWLHCSQTWAQVIGTGTGIATFLMVLLIQSTQNRNSRAINLKLNELFRAIDNARNQLIDIERLSDLELDEMQATCEKIKTSWTNRQTRTPRGAEEKLHWASRSSGRSKAWGTALVVFLLILRPGRAP